MPDVDIPSYFSELGKVFCYLITPFRITLDFGQGIACVKVCESLTLKLQPYLGKVKIKFE